MKFKVWPYYDDDNAWIDHEYNNFNCTTYDEIKVIDKSYIMDALRHECYISSHSSDDDFIVDREELSVRSYYGYPIFEFSVYRHHEKGMYTLAFVVQFSKYTIMFNRY